MQMTPRLILQLFLALAVFTVLPLEAASASRIEVVVNNKPITEFDIDQHRRLMRLVNNGTPISRQEAINQLIDMRLQNSAAERMSVNVPEEEVNQRLDSIAANTPLKTRERFLQGLQRDLGIHARTIRDFIRTQLAWGEIVRAVGANQLSVRESEVDMFLRNNNDGQVEEGEEETVSEYLLQQIVVVVPGNASGGDKAALRRQAENVRSIFRSCEDMAAKRGELKNVVIRDMGWQNETLMSEEQRQRLSSVGVNQVSGISTIDAGYELIAVCDKRQTDENLGARRQAQASLRQEKGGVVADKLLRDLRANALIEYR